MENTDTVGTLQIVDWVILAVLIIIIFALARRGRTVRKEITPPQGQRVRPIALELLEPILEFVIIGVVLWRDLTTDIWHIIVGLIAIVPGIALGYFRAREYYVRALPEYKAVIVRYSSVGIVLLVIIIALRIFAESTERMQIPYWVTLIVTGLLIIILAESFARVGIMYRWYRRDIGENNLASH